MQQTAPFALSAVRRPGLLSASLVLAGAVAMSVHVGLLAGEPAHGDGTAFGEGGRHQLEGVWAKSPAAGADRLITDNAVSTHFDLNCKEAFTGFRSRRAGTQCHHSISLRSVSADLHGDAARRR